MALIGLGGTVNCSILCHSVDQCLANSAMRVMGAIATLEDTLLKDTDQAACDFLMATARYGIGTRSSQLHSTSLYLMTNEVKIRMEVGLENHQEVFSKPFSKLVSESV